MRAGGQSVVAVDADTLRLHLDVPDDDSFFAWDFDDYNIEQGEVVNVMHLSLQVIPEPSSLALLLLGMLALHRLRRRP
jgi:hypothetical protein